MQNENQESYSKDSISINNEDLQNKQSSQNSTEERYSSSDSSSKLKIIIVSLVIVLISAGTAFGAWFVYSNYFAIPSLEKLFYDTAVNINSLNTLKISYKADSKIQSAKQDDKPDIGSDIMSDFLGIDSDVIDIYVDGYQMIDKTNPENIRVKGQTNLTGPAKLGELSISNISLDDSLYLEITKFPEILSFFIDKDILKDKWIKIAKNDRESLIDKYSENFSEAELSVEENIENLRKATEGEQLFVVIEECKNFDDNGTKSLLCKFQIDGSAMKNITYRYYELSNPEAEENPLDKLDDKAWEDYMKGARNTTFEAIFTKKDHMLTSIKGFYEDKIDGKANKSVLEVSLSDFNVPVEITEPEETTSFTEVFSLIFGSFTKNITSSDQEIPSLAEAEKEARDAKRISDVKQIQTALELYYYDEGGYPIFDDEIILTSENFTRLDSSGFSVNEEREGMAYLSRIPENPTPGGQDYTYICEDGKNYELDFQLEKGAGQFKAGELKATPSGIEQVSTLEKSSDGQGNFDGEELDYDNDGLTDIEELTIYGTEFMNPDTDGDGYTDGEEVENGYNPLGEGRLNE